MKTRTDDRAILHDRPGQWTAADLQIAQPIANCIHRPGDARGSTAAEVWRTCVPISGSDRPAFRRAVERQQD